MWLKQLHNVPPGSLSQALQADLSPLGNSGVLARVREWIDGKQVSYAGKLYAIIDMARLPEKTRSTVVSNLQTFKAHPLLDDPRYEQLKKHGAMLISHPKGDAKALLGAFGECDSNTVSAWLVSKLEAEPLALHLRHAAFASRPDGSRYLLRWYDPLITPVLFRLGDSAWVKWFLTPVTAWWYPVDSPQKETWSRVKGGDNASAQPPVDLVFSEELWDALVSDPLPYRILECANKDHSSFFTSDCYGVRLAQIEGLLESGRSKGLKAKDDLFLYVLGLLEKPARTEELGWQAALRSAVAGKVPLETYFTTLG